MLQRLSLTCLTAVFLFSTNSQSFASLLNEENPTTEIQSQAKNQNNVKKNHTVFFTSLNNDYHFDGNEVSVQRSRGGRRAGARTSSGRAALFKRGG